MCIKRQTNRKIGTQSHGSKGLLPMIAGLPHFWEIQLIAVGFF